jgi:hypothetical protein
MPQGTGEMVAVREQIMHLLHLQIEALDSPLELTDARLTECYERQARVQELRERLQALSDTAEQEHSSCEAASPSVQLVPASLDTAANV